MKYSILLCLFLSAGCLLHAQTRHDPAFNALDYSLQKRYKAEDAPFSGGKFTDNTFVTIGIGMAQTGGVRGNSYSLGGKYAIGYGKWLNPHHGMRLSLIGDTFRENHEGRRIVMFGPDISYLFRMTSYVDGYSLSRMCELSMLAGLGGRLSMKDGNLFPMANLHLGLNASVKLSKSMDFILEPLVCFQSGNSGNLHSTGASYNFSYSVNAGLSYNFIRDGYTRDDVDYKSDVFISFMGGVQFQNSSMMYETVGPVKSLGPHISISVGKKISDLFSFRPSVFYSHDTWGVYLEEIPYKSYYAGLRIEGMLEFLHFIPGYKRNMALSILAGPELAIMYKEDVKERIIAPYLGLGAGIQYKFRVYRYIHAFLEPRVSLVPYSFNSSGSDFHPNVLENYFDCLFNFNFGVGIDL